jgi:polyvinyl alcohol dehydrogenase (cytochrome)
MALDAKPGEKSAYDWPACHWIVRRLSQPDPGCARWPGTEAGIFLIGLLSSILLVDCAHKQTAPPPDGAVVFQQKCVICHAANSQTRAPLLESLRQMSKTSIMTALQTGEMKAQGVKLSRAEKDAVAGYLANPKTSGRLTGFCPADLDPPANSPVWSGWGVDQNNSRYQPAPSAGLSREQVPKLKVKWAFGFPGASATFGQPTAAGGKIFVGSEEGTVYSIDAHTGCIWWTYQASATVKTAVSIGADQRLAFFGDTNGNVYAVTASSGTLVWKVHPEPHVAARITGSPLLDSNRLYVPISSGEEGAAADPKYECCTFRGSLVALDAASGRQLWKAYTIRDLPKPTHRNAAGTEMWGPSGSPIWSAPTVDTKRRAIYVATGNNYSDPPTDTSDAVMAFDVGSGRLLWVRQITARDLWNIACVADTKANCPEKPGEDLDFGAPPLLRALPGGDVLLVAQKSGVVHALDPDSKGRIIWQKRIGRGGPLGGIEWGGAADSRHVYFPLSDWQGPDPEAGGGLFALNIRTGKRSWYSAPVKPACLGQFGCSAAQMAPPTLIDGVLFSGSLDGHLRAYDTRDGKVIWDFNAVQAFRTVNGVNAHGGSFNGSGPTIVSGMVYVNAGYTNELDGNILLALSPDGQ